MKNQAIIAIIALLVIGLFFIVSRTSPDEVAEEAGDTDKEQLSAEVAQAITVTPIEHATAVLTLGDVVVYVDPLGGGVAFTGQPEPEIILITDVHGDHFNISTLTSVTKDTTVIIAPSVVRDMLPTHLKDKTVVLANGEKTEQKGIHIEAIPMYNLPERTDEAHTKGRGNGYVLEKDGARIYVAGDTEGTPEMRALKDINVALIPMNLPFTMSVEDAADAVLAFAPAVVYPYHYRGSDTQKFKELVNQGNPEIEVKLLYWYPTGF